MTPPDVEGVPNPALLADDDVRALIARLAGEEHGVSRRRNEVHAAIDVLRAELLRRLHIEQFGRLPGGGPQEAVVVLGGGTVLEPTTLPTDRIRELVVVLGEEERELSRRRRTLHEQIDRLHEELLARLDDRIKRAGTPAGDIERGFRVLNRDGREIGVVDHVRHAFGLPHELVVRRPGSLRARLRTLPISTVAAVDREAASVALVVEDA